MRAVRWLALVVLASCASTEDSGPRDGTTPSAERAPAPEHPLAGVHRVIQDAEWSRRPTPSLLEALRHEDAGVRSKAVLALGRMPYPEHGLDLTRELLRMLFDEESQVRGDAAFALGLRGDPAAADKLVRLAVDRRGKDPEPEVRARALEGASRLIDSTRELELMFGLKDRSSIVRYEAVVATHRWPLDSPSAADVNRTLEFELHVEPDHGIRWAYLFALQRRNAQDVAGTYIQFSNSDVELERIFAVRGLARVPRSSEVTSALLEASMDRDWRVASEAVGALGRERTPGIVDALIAAGRHASTHVRTSALAAAASLLATPPADDSETALDGRLFTELVRPAHGSDSVALRAASQEPWLRYLAEGSAPGQVPWLEWPRLADLDLPEGEKPLPKTFGWQGGVDRSPYVRAANASAVSAILDESVSMQVLSRFANDPHPAVGIAAVAGLASQSDPQARDLLHGYLTHEDNGMRLAAAQAIGVAPTEADLDPLLQSILDAEGDISSELRVEVMRVVAGIGGDKAEQILGYGASDPDPFVRQVALSELGTLAHPSNPGRVQALDASESGALDSESSIHLRRGVDPWIEKPNPWVAIETERGTMLFELFPGEAPLHVHNFLSLIDRGHFSGLPFHRVVSNFVVQGGDVRGDGNGGAPFDGHALPGEFGTRKYLRGSLGMPRYDDPDSGGSQIFVTHRPTPHLDGRYTLFGQLREGFGVLDRIEIGDRILSVSRVPQDG